MIILVYYNIPKEEILVGFRNVPIWADQLGRRVLALCGEKGFRFLCRNARSLLYTFLVF